MQTPQTQASSLRARPRDGPSSLEVRFAYRDVSEWQHVASAARHLCKKYFRAYPSLNAPCTVATPTHPPQQATLHTNLEKHMDVITSVQDDDAGTAGPRHSPATR